MLPGWLTHARPPARPPALLPSHARSLGGLRKDLAVELSNGNMAVVVEVTPEHVQLDANNMMSGKTLNFELEVVSIDRH